MIVKGMKKVGEYIINKISMSELYVLIKFD